MEKINSENLYEIINDGVIKAGTKINVYKDDIYITTIIFNGYDFIWEPGTFSSGNLFNPLYDFEIIEEDKDIEKMILMFPDGMEFDCYIRGLISIYNTNFSDIKNKIDELIDEVNRLKNKE